MGGGWGEQIKGLILFTSVFDRVNFFQKKYFFKNIHVKTNYFRIYYILIYLHFLLFSTPQYLCRDQFCFMMLISQTMTSISNFGERKMAFLVDFFVSKYFVLAFGFQHTCTFVHIAHDICTFFLFSRNKTKKSTKKLFWWKTFDSALTSRKKNTTNWWWYNQFVF